jgi:hypothetical protein
LKWGELGRKHQIQSCIDAGMSDGYEYVCERPTNRISVHKMTLASSSGWPYWTVPAALASLAAALYSAAGNSLAILASAAVLLLVSILYLAAQRFQVLEGQPIDYYTHTKVVVFDCCSDPVELRYLHLITQSL